MLFNSLCAAVLENINFGIKLSQLLDRNGSIAVQDYSDGRDSDFFNNNVQPMLDALESRGQNVNYTQQGNLIIIRRVHVPEPPPELKPWDKAKKDLEKRRIDRGHAHSGKMSNALMARKVQQQRNVGQPIDNTFNYAKKYRDADAARRKELKRKQKEEEQNS